MSSIQQALNTDGKKRIWDVTRFFYLLIVGGSVPFVGIFWWKGAFFYSIYIAVLAISGFSLAAWLHLKKKPYHFHLLVLCANAVILLFSYAWGKAATADCWIHILLMAPLVVAGSEYKRLKIYSALFPIIVMCIFAVFDLDTAFALNDPLLISVVRVLNLVMHLFVVTGYLIYIDSTNLKFRARVMEMVDQLKNSHRLIESQEEKLSKRLVNAGLGEMAGGLAHEINNPLAIVTLTSESALSLIESDFQEDGSLEKLLFLTTKLENAAQRATSVMNSLAVFGRIGVEALDAKQSLGEIQSRLTQIFDPKRQQLGVQISWLGFSGSSMELVPVDIEQVLICLISNALDAVQEKSPKKSDDRWVQVACKWSERRLYFSVTDSGSGVSEQNKSKLFQPFFTTKPIGLAKGLGLAVSHGIVESLKGEISYNSTSPHTQFIFWIPTQPQELALTAL